VVGFAQAVNSPLHSAHQALQARFGSYFGATLPAAYGALETECRIARQSVAVFDTNYHAIFGLDGTDRARYLNAVTSGDIKSLTPGHGALGLLLNAQGHILADLETYALEDRFLILSHASVGARTLETLEKYIIMDDCTLTDAFSQWATVALEGPRAADALRSACGVALSELGPLDHKEAQIAGAPCRILHRSHFDFPGAEILARADAIASVWQSLLDVARAAGGGPIGWEAINSLRIEAGVRWFGYDFDDTVIPQEAGLETTHISYTKGCYTGQEIVERVRSRGRLNRWLVLLEFDAAASPQPGAKLLADGKEWGHVTSAAFSPLRNANIGFGYLRREHSAPGSVLEYAGGTARVLESPANPPKNVPHSAACA
jgi:folate-binding protein YgfZ